jgi:hypothetical protein
MEKSLAYSPEHNTMFGCFNLTERGKAAGEFKEELTEAIENLPDEIPGVISSQVYLPKNIYDGPKTNLSPDVFFIINDYRTTVEIDIPRPVFMDSPSINLRTGGHQPEGIFIAAGDAFKNNKVSNVSVLDVTPTILSLFDLEIPGDMDGRALQECLVKERWETPKPKNEGERAPDDRQEESMTEDELEEMRKMLKSLGYL